MVIRSVQRRPVVGYGGSPLPIAVWVALAVLRVRLGVGSVRLVHVIDDAGEVYVSRRGWMRVRRCK